MNKKRKALSLHDRQSIWVMKSSGKTIREIAKTMSRDASIISRELRRNAAESVISVKLSALEKAKLAHDRAKERAKNKKRGKRKACPQVRVYEHIAKKLQDKWSPECISAKWGEFFSGESISTSTIYRMIKKDWPKLKQYLPEKGRIRRARVMDRRGKVQQAAAEKRHVSERCEKANNREEEGHLEIDSIVSKRGSKSAVLSIIDRKLRKKWYIFVPDLKARTVRKALIKFLHTLKPEQRRTITFDRGSEFAEWEMLEVVLNDLVVYFCTAYAPHEKGSVERSNREFRRFFPKGTDFSQVSQADIDNAQHIINNKPMKCFNWLSPLQFEDYLNELQNILKEAA